jgi:hypothetical protein
MVRELISLPFRIAGKVAEGAVGLVLGGKEAPPMPGATTEEPAAARSTPVSAHEPGDSPAQTERSQQQPPRSSGGRDPAKSDWDEDVPVPPGGSDPDDNLLADKVSSEVLGRVSAPTGEINLNVENGVVFLRGHLDDPAQAEELVDAAGQVEGVLRVENLIEA